jgi:hypothetical protein
MEANLPPAPCLHSRIRTIGRCDATTPKPLRAGVQDVAYLEAVEGAFGGDIDYAMLVSSTAKVPMLKSVTALPSALARARR